MVGNDQARPLAPVSAYYPRSDEVDEAISKEFDLRQRGCLRCCGCTTAVLLILAVTTLVLFFTVLRIREPVVTAERFAFSQLQRGTSLGLLNFSMEITVSVRNPNAAAFRYENATTSLYYRGEVVGKGGVPPGTAGARGRKQLNLTVAVDGGKVAGAEGFVGDWRSGNLSFWSETWIAGKVKITDAIKKKLAVRLNRNLTYVVDTQQHRLALPGMESFTLLKFWRRSTSPSAPPSHPINTLLASADTDDGLHDGSDAEEDDEGPFFDLQLDLSDEEDDDDKGLHPVDNAEASSASEGDDEREEGGDRTDSIDRGLNFVISPRSVNDASDDSGIFFKGDILPILPSSDNATSPKPAHSPVALLKPSTKLRVLISGLKKPAAQEKSEKGRTGSELRQNRRLFIKFKAEEKPFASLFARDNSSKITSANKHDERQASADHDIASAEDGGLSREAKMQRYLKKVKPLYVGVSKLRPSSQLRSAVETQKVAHDVNGGGSSDAEPGRGNDGEPGAGIKVGFGVMCRQLGKSRSASAAVAATPSPSSASSRRDDSLLQQQDGIQGAILHCKRSFNESRDSNVNGLGRSASDSSHRIATESMVESSTE